MSKPSLLVQILDAHHRLHIILLLASFSSVEFTSHLFTELYSSYLTVPIATQFLASGLLWFDASSLGMWFLIFWRNVLASSSKVKRPFRMPVRVKQWGCIDRSDHWWLYEADGKLIGRCGNGLVVHVGEVMRRAVVGCGVEGWWGTIYPVTHCHSRRLESSVSSQVLHNSVLLCFTPTSFR